MAKKAAIAVEEVEEPIFRDCSKTSVQELYRPVLSEYVKDDLPILGSKEHSWWQEQIKRCLHGWIAPDGRYINGYHYFYINFVTLPIWDRDEKRFKMDRPKWRDNDSDVLNILWGNRMIKTPDGGQRNARNHIEGKPRGIGWTYYTLCAVKLYFFIFKPDRPVGSAYPDDQNVDEERNMFQKAWDLLHPVFKTWKGIKLEVLNNNTEEFVVGEKIKGDKLNRVHNVARFDVIGTESAGVYKGARMYLMIAVEAGKWKKNSLKNYISENEPSARLGDTQWGSFIIGGTSNAIINPSSAYKDLFYGHKKWNATQHFSPGTKVLQGFFNEFTGKSDEKGAYAQKMRDRKAKEGDNNLYNQEVIENPLTPEEAFSPNLKMAYSAALINKQIGYIRENRIQSLWRRGKLEYRLDVYRNRTKQVEFVEDPTGEWLVNMEGLPNYSFEGLHIAGIDDRYKSRDPGKPVDAEASRNAMVVYRRSTIYPGLKSDMPVGIFLGEAADMNDAFEDFYKGMLFWDIKDTMYEYNADSFINFLKKDKKEFSRLYHIGDNALPGIKLTPKAKQEVTFIGSKWFNEGIFEKCTSIEILEALRIWGGKVNTDIGSAFHLVLLLRELMEYTMVTVKEQGHSIHTTYMRLGDPYEEAVSNKPSSEYFKLGQRAA